MENTNDINEQLENLQAKLRNTFGEINSRLDQLQTIKNKNSEERIQELEDLMLLLHIENEKNRTVEGRASSILADPESSNALNIMQEKIRALEEDILRLKDGSPNLVVQDTGKLEEEISGLERGNETTVSKETIASIKNSPGKGRDHLEAVKNLDEKVSEVNRIMEATKKEFTQKVWNIEEKFEAKLDKLEKVKSSLDLKFADLQAKVQEFQTTERKAESAMPPRQIVAVDEKKGSAEKANNNYNNNISNDLLTELQARLEEGSVNVISIEKSLRDIRQKIASIDNIKKDIEIERKAINEAAEATRNYNTHIEKRVNDLENQHHLFDTLKMELGNESASRLALEKDMADIKFIIKGKVPASGYLYNSGIEKTSAPVAMHAQQADAHAAEFSNQLTALRSKLMQETADFSRFMKESDLSSLRNEMKEQHNTLKSIDKRIEKSAMKFFAENMEDFARALDKRMPSLVSREAYEHDMHLLGEKLRRVQGVDSQELYARMETLEREMGQILISIRSMLTRIPMVVE